MKINMKCTACGNCSGDCPTEAITEKDGKFEIDETICIKCYLCHHICKFKAIEGD